MNDLTTIGYVLAAALFILGLKRLSSPRTARGGNRLAALGMLLAVMFALLESELLNPVEVIAGLIVGGAIGAVLARATKMTAMPELVAAFNGFGGGASALVAAAEVVRVTKATPDTGMAFSYGDGLIIALSVLIGAVTFSGSFVAFAKLRGSVRSMGFRGLRLLSFLFGAATVGVIAWMVLAAPDYPISDGLLLGLGVLAAVSLVLGVLLVWPIGGADMPVVVALLNSYSGLAAAATGFVLSNYALIISGTLVGVSGVILTRIMCVAMNRSLANVLLGGFGADAAVASGPTDGEEKSYNTTTPDDAAVMLAYAQKVVIAPGYGLAVAQAQHEVRELADVLQGEGVEVSFAIHPVAGRMPGHMNVLLAEANVPYDQLVEMDDINADFPQTDVVLVVGANDVVNPGARDDPDSAIYGMPVLHVDEAQQVIVLKRSMRPGYAGIENPLFYKDNTAMLFGDAKESVKAIIDELKELQPA